MILSDGRRIVSDAAAARYSGDRDAVIKMHPDFRLVQGISVYLFDPMAPLCNRAVSKLPLRLFQNVCAGEPPRLPVPGQRLLRRPRGPLRLPRHRQSGAHSNLMLPQKLQEGFSRDSVQFSDLFWAKTWDMLSIGNFLYDFVCILQISYQCGQCFVLVFY